MVFPNWLIEGKPRGNGELQINTMKKTIELTEQADRKGIQVQIAGRIDRKEIARVEWIREGRALKPAWITSRQIKAGRRAMTRYARHGGKIWVRIFPYKPVTLRPTETSMGSGKGSPNIECLSLNRVESLMKWVEYHK
ncbi:hypothetical protein MKW94_008095 [Papaver nudicaule]|uniref:50S ribosomal protein L16, chloroplastic n=1 Tax=Papaver nudicaule TaxID=74823 RepID=A0AA41VFL2_PAPNU|nr:hypothetical protein [Papaver nudicaule]